jgi:hypothetical protein
MDREFFVFGPSHMNWVWWAFRDYPAVLSFSAPDWHRYAPKPVFPEDHEETWIYEGEYLSLPSVAPIEDGALKVVAE